MIWLAVAPVVLTVLVGRSAPRIARTCPPRWAAASLVAAAMLASLATGIVLCAVAVLGIAQWPASAHVGHWSADTLSDHAWVPWPAALAASAVAIVLLAGAGRQLVRSVRQFVAAARACRAVGPGSNGLIVISDNRLQALALPGFGGRIVLTDAMLRRLGPSERRAVLTHESAHLRHGHFVYVQLAELAAAANPLLRPVVRAVRLAVECWADDEAARAVGDPMVVARAIAKVGLAQRSRSGIALAMADTALAWRITGLTSGRPRRTRWALAVVAAALAGAVCALIVSADAHGLFEVAQARYLHR